LKNAQETLKLLKMQQARNENEKQLSLAAVQERN
jgi:hypothetical protein